jgi:hypothetical protein
MVVIRISTVDNIIEGRQAFFGEIIRGKNAFWPKQRALYTLKNTNKNRSKRTSGLTDSIRIILC